ncbi:MAG: hypothetical protein E7048_00115 [Lentisphaerae bacterium]|nr:hypothetical protein [Lentisphaerota bacterium]
MKKTRLTLIILALLVLLGSIGMTVCLLFSNYQNVRLFKQAQNNFLPGDDAALALAETQLLQLIRSDSDNEAAFIMLADIALKKKIYPEQVYYRHMACQLNPLSKENKEKYIESLCFARYFQRLEHFLAQYPEFEAKFPGVCLYAAGRNGNINKYKARYRQDDPFTVLAFQLFKFQQEPLKKRLAALKALPAKTPFLQQEILAAQAELHLEGQDWDNAEKALVQVWKLNEFAFAPTLGRFYARYRTLGKALEVFEKHLALYHDQSVAIQVAEIYCLLNQTGKIARLRTDFQADSGKRAMLCNYYFDTLIAFAKKDMAALKELTVPLRKNMGTPLAAFIFFCTDVQKNDLAAIQTSYTELLAQGNYLDLLEQADNIVSGYLKKSFAENKTGREKLLPLANLLYSRKPEIFTAKFILLAQKKTNSVNIVLLKDALKRFKKDQGLIKIAIEYYLQHEVAEAGRLIAYYKQNFPQRSGDMLRYEIVLNMQKKDYEKVSELFRKNFSAEILPAYWNFASSLKREKDLLFLSKDKFYEPFCKALLLINAGKKQQACDLLEKADAKNNQMLLFFAAKTLAENGHSDGALKKYALFPRNSLYTIPVLLNMAELYSEKGELDQALLLAKKAYNLAPQMPETQLCYGDKLYKKGKLSAIPDVVKLSASKTYRRKLEALWIAGIQQRIKECDINTQREKIREMCRQILVIAPRNDIALDYLKHFQKMPQ